MKRNELEIEQYYKEKFISRHRYKSTEGVIVLGHSRNADIRLLGEDVNEIHAYLEFQNDKWFVIDAGSTHGTWINKKPLTTKDIDKETTISLGGHQLKLIPHMIEGEVFSDESLKRKSGAGNFEYHQIILRKKDAVIRTEMLKSNSPYFFYYSGKNHKLPAPQKDEIKTTEFGPYKLIQRLVVTEKLSVTWQDFFSHFRNPEMRTPIIAVISLVVILSGLILAIPERPKDEMLEVKPDNKYTQMVFDSELMKKKRAEAKEMRKTIMASSPKSREQANAITPTPTKNKAPTPKVVSQLKLEGLNSLLGKIAKRANVKGPKITAFGKTVDDRDTGHASVIPSMSNVKGVVSDSIGDANGTFKVSGVTTAGKGGGNGRALAGVAGLTVGGAGSSTVGVLDEETEIDGGLDKEVISKVISNYLGEIRYCYERQLSAEPDIYGKVQIKFTIDADGTVGQQRIGVTTLKSAMVEGCILRRLARWKFPKPKGGTHVFVTYPFMFKSTN